MSGRRLLRSLKLHSQPGTWQQLEDRVGGSRWLGSEFWTLHHR